MSLTTNSRTCTREEWVQQVHDQLVKAGYNDSDGVMRYAASLAGEYFDSHTPEAAVQSEIDKLE